MGFSQIFLIALVRIYQVSLGFFLRGHCRFFPSCSSYAVDAIKHHGSLRGGGLIFCRLLRCHPWCDGGFDPVPLILIEGMNRKVTGCIHE